MNERTSKIIGATLIVIALFGFLTLADDLRHVGEFFAVAGILSSGAALFVAGQFPRLVRHFALGWVSIGIGVGMLAGAITDQVPISVCAGGAFGTLLARWFRRRVLPSGGCCRLTIPWTQRRPTCS